MASGFGHASLYGGFGNNAENWSDDEEDEDEDDD